MTSLTKYEIGFGKEIKGKKKKMGFDKEFGFEIPYNNRQWERKIFGFRQSVIQNQQRLKRKWGRKMMGFDTKLGFCICTYD